MLDSLATTVKELTHLPGLLKQFYGDLAAPGVKQVGKAIGTLSGLFNTVLAPIEYGNDWVALNLNKNMEKLRLKLENTSEEEIIPIQPEIGKLLLEKLFYVSNEDLVELYLNLTKRASIRQECHMAHPNFVNIVTSLSPDEARIIQYAKGQNIPYISPCIEITENSNSFTYGTMIDSRSYYTGLEKVIEILFPENMDCYFTNMFCLGLTDATGVAFDDTDEAYLKLETEYKKEISSTFKALKKANKSELAVSTTYSNKINKGKIKFTQFGKLFVAATSYDTFSKSTSKNKTPHRTSKNVKDTTTSSQSSGKEMAE